MKRILPFLALALLLTACGSLNQKPSEENSGATAEQMYSEAKSELDSGNYTRSVKLFESLQARYPYGRYAQQADLEIAYANFKDQEPTLALAAIDRFLKQHPANPNVDYALYLRGLVNFIDDRTLFASIAKQNMAERDPKAAKESFEAFRDLVTRFPQSRYAPDSRDRMAFLVTALADHDLSVASYYYKRGAYLAAANRSKEVVLNYANTDRVETALAMMAAAYDKLGQNELRDDARRVFAKNYPQSKITEESILAESPWWKLW
ncbi:outer membrane protein assembly factor BamD [Chitinimonas arctica]|uniref:Outer membrane protein assembly factor BamD n=1 Tax=Chitinimonas arctica TaxID=2594795 RepID=A0A516SHG4_9NEIS|nr:outer membrane protein assembly factor BamD [Chitinimonas arctica]QDQ27606.1 outer membrane protein assembly factor BamD [Chitinimonas arctica]